MTTDATDMLRTLPQTSKQTQWVHEKTVQQEGTHDERCTRKKQIG